MLNRVILNQINILEKMLLMEQKITSQEKNRGFEKMEPNLFGCQNFQVETNHEFFRSQLQSLKSTINENQSKSIINRQIRDYPLFFQLADFVISASVGHQLAENVTGIIGLKESITTKHPILKYIWAFLFCIGIGATIFFIYATAKEYLDEPTLTKVRFF